MGITRLLTSLISDYKESGVEEEKKNLEGLGGWLILVALGIVISPVRIILLLAPTYLEIFSNGSWEALTTPGSAQYSPYWAPLLIAEIAINGALVFAWVYIAFLFFAKKARFPKWFIGIMVFTVAFVFADAAASKAALPNEPIFDLGTAQELGRALIATLIWVPYMLKSKRVKATFVK
jgi:hypothetical protein